MKHLHAPPPSLNQDGQPKGQIMEEPRWRIMKMFAFHYTAQTLIICIFVRTNSIENRFGMVCGCDDKYLIIIINAPQRNIAFVLNLIRSQLSFTMKFIKFIQHCRQNHDLLATTRKSIEVADTTSNMQQISHREDVLKSFTITTCDSNIPWCANYWNHLFKLPGNCIFPWHSEHFLM